MYNCTHSSKLKVHRHKKLRDMESEASHIALYALAGMTGFLCGIYLQHEASVRNLIWAIQRDPNLFYFRQKLYPILPMFSTNFEARLFNKLPTIADRVQEYVMSSLCEFLMTRQCENYLPNIMELMKYGLPSLDNLTVHKNYIISQDSRPNCIRWVCEHLTRKRKTGRLNEIASYKFIDIEVLSKASDRLGAAFKSRSWHELNQRLNWLINLYGSVYTYTGPIFLPAYHNGLGWTQKYEILDWMPTPVPTYYFKVLIIDSQLENRAPYLECFIIQNKPHVNKRLEYFLSDINEIEIFTGLRFVKGLPQKTSFSIEDLKTTEPILRKSVFNLFELKKKLCYSSSDNTIPASTTHAISQTLNNSKTKDRNFTGSLQREQQKIN